MWREGEREREREREREKKILIRNNLPKQQNCLTYTAV